MMNGSKKNGTLKHFHEDLILDIQTYSAINITFYEYGSEFYAYHKSYFGILKRCLGFPCRLILN